MFVWIVEGDPLQAVSVARFLEESVEGIRTDRIATEEEFYRRFGEIQRDSVVLLEVMLRKGDPLPGHSATPGRFYDAGFRCLARLQDDPRTNGISVILYTVLERGDLADRLHDLPENVVYIRKSPDRSALLGHIKK